MPHRNPVPRLWLMTDERMGDALWRALQCIPPGSGVVIRHYQTPPAQRRALALRIRRIAQARRLVVVARPGFAGIDGVHGAGRGGSLRTWPAHDRREAMLGARAGADALFVSPIYPTRSHPGAPAIGPAAALRVARGLGLPIIALGGMTAARWRRLRMLGFHGWAAIDAWT